MLKITLPVSNPKKALSGDLLKNAIPKPLPAGTTRPSAIKAVAGGLAGASTRGIGAIPAGAETDAGTNGESSKLNPTQQRDAAVVAKLPSGFPIKDWDSMSYKAQLQAMKFSGLTEQEQWQLLNPSAPLRVLDAANRERIQAVASAGVGKSTEILTNPSKTTYLQNGESDGQLGKDGPIATPRPGPTPPYQTPDPRTIIEKRRFLVSVIADSNPSATWDTRMINNQEDYSSTLGTLGEKGSISGNGCGFIAINNVNQLLGDKTNFADVYYELNSQEKTTTMFRGWLGMITSI